MSDFHSVNVIAKPVADLPLNSGRTYLALYATDNVTVTIYTGGVAGQSFIVAANTQWGPQPPPMNEIRFSGTGTIIEG